MMTLSAETIPLVGPNVRYDLPGLRLARRGDRESNARTYPRRLPIATVEVQGNFVKDVDGKVLIDFLGGVGVLSLGHKDPYLVRAVIGQLRVLTHRLDLPSPTKDEFANAQLPMPPPGMRERMKAHFCE